ncbi:MAG: carboxysome shell carbonic anhydrase [Gammaproteobacteria bacterium]|nr:carboxysome shell carbonic anhydrase [Gammaproteobacteria bacterium]
MLRRNKNRSTHRGRPGVRAGQATTVYRSRPNTVEGSTVVAAAKHPMVDGNDNGHLYQYEQAVKKSFDAIVPTLRKVSALQHEDDFVGQAQAAAMQQLGYPLPEEILQDAWVEQLDMRSLFAWCVFKNYHRFCDEFFANAPLNNTSSEEFQNFIQGCGFHTLDISPCADGRLAHAIRYVLRLPIDAVRRKSYAGAMFDIDNSIQKWVETEMLRYREGLPNTADSPTRYLKTVAYHFSSVDPSHEGCAAHGSDDAKAAAEGLNRLKAFQEAIENSFCCGASIDLLLLGIDTDTDAIKVHVPDANGKIDLDRFVDAKDVYQQTQHLSAVDGMQRIEQMIRDAQASVSDGMLKLISKLIANNLSQIEYVRSYYGSHYEDIGHAERFIGAGIGFEEVQLRNLTYFAYLDTVEESTADFDVGIKIFSKLNVAHGLPVPIVIRFDYHGQVPGSRERAIEHCQRVSGAVASRYSELAEKGLLHTLLVVRDCNANGQIEILGSSLKAAL